MSPPSRQQRPGPGKSRKRTQSEGVSGKGKAQAHNRRKSNAGQTHPMQRFLVEDPYAACKSPAGFTTASDSNSNIHTSVYRHLKNVVGNQEFRLLIVGKGAGTDRIKCKLTYSNLQNPPVYTALSYTWLNSHYHSYAESQEPEGESSIWVNKHRFTVAPNLRAALWHLRSSTEPKTFWIDKICVDQTNINERSHQVQLMYEIYRRAANVIAWLGISYDRSSHVFNLIRTIAREPDYGQRRHMFLREFNSPESKFAEAYRKLFQRTYWYRTWIIQEVVAAADVSIQSGEDIVPWNALVDFQSWLINECWPPVQAGTAFMPQTGREAASFERMKTYLISADVDRFGHLSVLRYAALTMNFNNISLTLESLLLHHWGAVAMDPKDKIFAIIRLASNGHEYFRLTSGGDQNKMEVDYKMSVLELFTYIARRTIELTGKLSIILPRRGPGRPKHKLPSWCTDWSSSEPASKLGNWHDVHPFQVYEKSRSYYASGLDSRAQVRYGGTRRSLIAKGFVLDDVSTISQYDTQPEAPKSKQHSSSFWSFMDCFGFTRRRRRRRPTHPPPEGELEHWYSVHRSTLRSTFIRGVRNGSIPEGRDSFRKFCREQHTNFFWILHRATNILSHEVPHRNRSADTREFLQRWNYCGDIPSRYSEYPGRTMTDDLRNVCGDMGEIAINENYTNFFVTRGGALGLGPMGMLENDRVVVLFGCDVPVVLRRREGRRECYTIVGQCYIAGAMHGEWAAKQRESWGDDLSRYPEFEIR